MTDMEWFSFFKICAKTLGTGRRFAVQSQTWCAWTTFSKLQEDVHYWNAGLPNFDDIAESYIKDTAVWGQPFLYQDLAHIVIPREFYWECVSDRAFSNGSKYQDIKLLSVELNKANIAHRVTDVVLEIKLY